MNGLGYLWFGIGYLALYVTGGWLLHGQPLARSIFGNTGLLLQPLAVCVIITALGGKVTLGPDGSVHGSRNFWPRA